MEILAIDEVGKLTVPHLLGTVKYFLRKMFGPDVDVKYRASYFPFTELVPVCIYVLYVCMRVSFFMYCRYCMYVLYVCMYVCMYEVLFSTCMMDIGPV